MPVYRDQLVCFIINAYHPGIAECYACIYLRRLTDIFSYCASFLKCPFILSIIRVLGFFPLKVEMGCLLRLLPGIDFLLVSPADAGWWSAGHLTL